MKGFSMHQPFAYAVVAGLKGNETRGHKTNIRGRVFIHATKKDPWKSRFISLEDIPKIEALLTESQGLSPSCPAKLEYGAIIGTVELVDCVPVDQIVDSISERERLLGDYSPGRFAWKLKDPVMFEKPIPVKGKQGWWNWNEAEVKI